jgi:hypothetical protein
MKTRIDQLLGTVSTPSYPVPSLSPQRQERILNMTKQKIHTEKQPYRMKRPFRIITVAAAAALLLCGSVFAAYEFQLFDFSHLFGQEASLIEDAVFTYSPETAASITAFSGLTDENHASAQDYNFTLLGDAQVSDSLIYAVFDISKVDETVPDFTASGLTLEIEGYDTKSFTRGVGGIERIVVYAQPEAPLSAETTLNFVLGSDVVLADVPITLSDANTAVFTENDPDADYVLDTAAFTNTTLTVTGHFQKSFADYDAALDASGTLTFGGIPWPLKDAMLDTYDPNDGTVHEDLEGYLTLREVSEDGSFTLEWTFIKGIPDYGTITLDGVSYTVPERESDNTTISDHTPNYATSAKTQDYQFSLESMVASGNAIYAVIDMEPLTDYGANHMNLGYQELSIVCSDMSNQSGGSVGSSLIESGDEVSRYLVYSTADSTDAFQSGDVISFSIQGIKEDGDTAEHGYSLFDVMLETVLPDTAEATLVGTPNDDLVSYDSVVVTPLSLYLEGTYAGTTDENGLAAADRAGAEPEIILSFRDGSSYTIMDSDWSPDPDHIDFGSYGIVNASVHGQGSEDSGTIYRTYLFSQVVSLEDLDTITIDGTVYQVDYENG